MSEVTLTEQAKPAASAGPNGASVEVFAVYGVEPEIQAYAMAKYSRSALSMKESLKEISRRRRRNFSTLSIFSTGTGRLPTWRTSRWRLSGCRFWRRLKWPTSSVGMGRSDRRAIRILRKSGYYTPDFGAEGAARGAYIARRSNFCLPTYENVSQRAC